MKQFAMACVIGLASLAGGHAMGQAKTIPADVSCDPPDADGIAKRCKIDVDVDFQIAGTCRVVVPNYIILKNKKKAVLVWDLPAGYRFCAARGDGVFLVDKDQVGDEQFDDFGVPDAGTGRPDFKECRNRFRILALNSKHSGPRIEYAYRLQFRRMSDNLVCTADPFIRNG